MGGPTIQSAPKPNDQSGNQGSCKQRAYFKRAHTSYRQHADVYVGYQCSVDQEGQLNAWGMRGIGGGMGGATTSTISNGTLAVDFYDPTSKDLIWRGSATKTLNPSGNQKKDMQKLNKAVAKLLKNFPPPQK
ncbi:MAG: DUF4136 domain-containing protein [Candidatus Acidiferrales bacterium]